MYKLLIFNILLSIIIFPTVTYANAHIGALDCNTWVYTLNGSNKKVSVPAPLTDGDVITIRAISKQDPLRHTLPNKECSMTIYILKGTKYRPIVLKYSSLKKGQYIVKTSSGSAPLNKFMSFVADWVQPFYKLQLRDDKRKAGILGKGKNSTKELQRTVKKQKKKFEHASRKLDRFSKNKYLKMINNSNLPKETKAILRAALNKKATGLSSSNKAAKGLKRGLQKKGLPGKLMSIQEGYGIKPRRRRNQDDSKT